MTRSQLALILAFATSACRESLDTAPPVAKTMASHEDEADHEALPRQLRVSDEVARASGIQTGVARRALLAGTVSMPGEVTAEPDRTARVSSATAGRLEHIGFNEGALVKKGDVLALLRVPDVGRLRGALSAVDARAKASRSNAERLAALKASGLGSGQAVLDAEAEAQAQEAEAAAIQEQLGAIGAPRRGSGEVTPSAGSGSLITLRAPLSGVVISRDAVVGQPIGSDHVVATIVDLSQVWFLGRVFEKDLGQLKAGAKADVQLNAFPSEHFSGVVEYIGQQTDPVARTFTARIRLENSTGHLRLGLFGSAKVAVDSAEQGEAHVLVPRSAVTDVGGQSIVFVKAADGDFMVHDVTLGSSALTQVQVLSGLTDGEVVVTEGVFTLKSLLLKPTLSEEH